MNWRNLIQIAPVSAAGSRRLSEPASTPTDVLEYLASGMTQDQILKDFPSLTLEHIRAVLAYAAERERRSTLTPSFGQNCYDGVSAPQVCSTFPYIIFIAFNY